VPETLSIDSFGPLPVERPASVADLCALVSRTRAAQHGLYPVAGRTALSHGRAPIKPGVACDLTALANVIDYPARDMTVTARAGITLAALQAELAKEGQWLPIDVPHPERATLGGMVAVNASGPRRYGYGTLRDYVIGISFVTDDAVEVKAGGRVVKNVAGYDLMKLHLGALGTLGAITQLTLKVRPKPEARAAVCFGCRPAALPAVLDALAGSRTRPVAVEALNPVAARAAGLPATADWALYVAFEEKAAAVRWQVETLLTELKSLAVEGAAETPVALDALTALQRTDATKRGVLPSRVAAELLASKAESVHAHALSGVIWEHGAGAPSLEAPAGAAWELMRHVKRTLDPDNVFNPGRLFGDL
jgi:glycolate oxidase FAD binding subunit